MSKPNIGKWFETAKRADGQHKGEADATYVRVAEGAPAWVLDAVRKAHQGALPCDWVFDECRAAAEAIDNCEVDEEVGGNTGEWITEHADVRVDVYTKVLFQWAADFCLTELFADAEERAGDLGDAGEKLAIEKRLSAIQFCAIDAIARTMLEAFNERCDDEDEETGS